MDLYNMDKWEELQSVDMAVRDVQLAFKKLEIYSDCKTITAYNTYLEKLRNEIHMKMKDVQKNI